jgi:glycosyltransferase involved in cell wall biosynthesis
MRISVCIATYNGERYIHEQISSILAQISSEDEVIIVDDCSKDKTISILNAFNDVRIKITINDKNNGHVKAFEKAISKSSGDYIFLSDQDDIWVDGRVSNMIQNLVRTSNLVVASDFFVFRGRLDKSSIDIKELPRSENACHKARALFLGTIPYFGCAMAFKKELLVTALPFPEYVESHDIWIAWNGLLNNGVSHLYEPTLYHRIHDKNVTPIRRRVMRKVLRTRIGFVKMIFVILSRKYRL